MLLCGLKQCCFVACFLRPVILYSIILWLSLHFKLQFCEQRFHRKLTIMISVLGKKNTAKDCKWHTVSGASICGDGIGSTLHGQKCTPKCLNGNPIPNMKLSCKNDGSFDHTFKCPGLLCMFWSLNYKYVIVRARISNFRCTDIPGYIKFVNTFFNVFVL